ncbi:hypothetical protein AD006_32525 (plasmid) [Pseudonocardia sp. EC080610-09]|nr:hypothetical protein AD006_32525 [Pseudonocardia sp. EC080610-09]
MGKQRAGYFGVHDRDAIELVEIRQQVGRQDPGDVVGQVVAAQAGQDGSARAQRAGDDLLVGFRAHGASVGRAVPIPAATRGQSCPPVRAGSAMTQLGSHQWSVQVTA